MDMNKFKDLLDEQNTWPEYYTFKFVVKSVEKEKLLKILTDQKITEKVSKKGTYTSITSRLYANSSDEIIDIYLKVKKIEGILSI